jgi:hypothetical protein
LDIRLTPCDGSRGLVAPVGLLRSKSGCADEWGLTLMIDPAGADCQG